uniref:Uncharacterized protein n=1 Tax=Arundo donax TaxID=35708 RepID=A0A0A8ZLC9_ARUDO
MKAASGVVFVAIIEFLTGFSFKKPMLYIVCGCFFPKRLLLMLRLLEQMSASPCNNGIFWLASVWSILNPSQWCSRG